MTPPILHLPAPSVVRAALAWTIHHRWLVLLLAGTAMVVAVAARAVLEEWRHRRHAAGAHLVTIAPPPQVESHAAAVLWSNLAGTLTPSGRRRLLYGAPHVVWQYTWTGRRLDISLWVPGSVPASAVVAAVRAAWPGATCITTPAEPPVPLDGAVVVGGQLWPAEPEWLPLSTDHDADPLRALLSAGSGLRGDEYACVQILARPAGRRRARRARRAAARIRDGRPAAGGVDVAAPLRWVLNALLPGPPARRSTGTSVARRDPYLERDVRAILDKTAHPLWQTGIRYTVAKTTGRSGGDPLPRLRGLADAVASSFAVYTGRNRLRRVRMPRPAAVMAGRRLGAGFLTSTPELAVLAGLPQDLAVPGLDRAHAKTMPASIAVPAGGRGTKTLGDAQAGGHAVALPVADARYHLHVLGSTGSGKSTLLVNMAVADITAHRGTIVIDPHGDLVTDILDRLPTSAAGRVMLFDPDQPNPPTINPLSGGDPDLVVDNLVSIFSNIFVKAWGPRMDDVMRVACLTLLRHPAQATLQHIPPLLNNHALRTAMTAGLDDPAGLSGFWQWYDELNPGLRSQVIGPVLARLRAFLLRDFVKRTMRYPHTSIDLGRILDGGALLVRIPKGQLGEDTTRLLGSLILAQVWQAATARATQPAEQRRDATLILDECQNFLTLATSLDTMLAEARKYRLSLVLAHQDLAQLPRELAAAMSANARNKIYFTCAPEDARILSRHTLPELDEHDLTHLSAYTAATRLVIDGRQTPAFTLATRPARPVVGAAGTIRAAAAEAVPAQEPSALDELVERYTNPAARARTSLPAGR